MATGRSSPPGRVPRLGAVPRTPRHGAFTPAAGAEIHRNRAPLMTPPGQAARDSDFGPPPPADGTPRCYAVVFTSLRTAGDADEYASAARRMEDLARRQPGFLGVESARGADGFGITVSYWESLEAIAAWGGHVEHRFAQEQGRARWYERFRLRICRVESERAFHRKAEGDLV